MATKAKGKPAPGLDFDESTPPPRRAYLPHGTDPIPAWVELPLNEPVAALFSDWAASGRVPDGSVLCEHVGTACGLAKHSGYKVVASPPGRAPLGEKGRVVPAADLDPYRVAVVVKEQGQPTARLVVMSPLPTPAEA